MGESEKSILEYANADLAKYNDEEFQDLAQQLGIETFASQYEKAKMKHRLRLFREKMQKKILDIFQELRKLRAAAAKMPGRRRLVRNTFEKLVLDLQAK